VAHGNIGAVSAGTDRSVDRTTWPWAVWAAVVVGLVPTMVLSVRNRSFDEDPFFIPVAVMMILGYSTVGAILSARTRRNPIGWLLLAVGVLFLLTGLSDEYLQSAEASGRLGSTLVAITALITSILWLPMLGIVASLILLFPTGTVPGPRWRPVPWLIAAGIGAYLVGTTLDPGPFDPEETGVPEVVMNPVGVEALGALTPVLIAAGTALGLLCILPALAGLLVRFRRATGEERQQIRWLAYVVATIVALVLVQIPVSALPGASSVTSLLTDVLWLLTFALIGIGVPITVAIAVLRYRLYDLDVVVKKTAVFVVIAALVTTSGVAFAFLTGRGALPSLEEAPMLVLLLGVGYGLLAIPLYRVSTRIADRLVYGGRATPYEILSTFSGRVGETYSTEDVLPRMAQLLGEATGAAAAHVWLRVGDEMRPAATWPVDAEPATPVRAPRDTLPPLHGAAVEVRHQGELLGALSVEMPPSDPMRPAKERIVRDLAAQAGLVLRNVRLIEELRESRRRIVAAQDDRAKKLERNIHDGAQQQLVALAVKARLAGSLASKDAERTATMLDEIQRDLTEALENLRDLARGIYPPLLADQGLAAAITAQARKSSLPMRVDADGAGRFAPEIEATVYFCVLEALQNVAKYAEATQTSVTLSADGRELQFSVTDDGRGFDAAAVSRGSGLQGIADRLSAVGGDLVVTSAPGRGTTVTGRVPTEEVPRG
jgi:signal transduction histidine kinase